MQEDRKMRQDGFLGNMEDDDHHLLELTLISAQGLKSPFSSNLRRLQTFAVTWIHPIAKLRTRIDRIGSENPTWNDKFLFRVSPSFLSGDTSALTVDIFAVGLLKDPLLGSVRVLLSSFLPLSASPSSSPEFRFRSPAFGAFQIRRHSGRFQGVLNVAARVIDVSDFGSLAGMSAIGYGDLIGKKAVTRRKHCQRAERSETGEGEGEESPFSGGESTDGGESTTSNSSAASTAVDPSSRILREMNGQEMERKNSGGERILCWPALPRKIHISPSDENIRVLCSSNGSH